MTPAKPIASASACRSTDDPPAETAEGSSRWGGQAQQPPPQQPPPDGAAGAGEVVARPATATVESSFTVSSCPPGHGVGALDSLIGRDSSNVSPHVRQRYS
jgi:hypothetical protein